MKTRYIIAPIVMLAMLALAAFSTPAMAQCFDDVETRVNGIITDGTVIALEGGSGNDPWPITLPPGEVKMAYVHWHTWGGCSGSPMAEFENGNGVHDEITIPDSLCPGGNNLDRGVWWSGASPANGTHHYYWKVNATEGDNQVTVCNCGYDKWFVAVINNTTPAHRTHDGHWWHNFGLMDEPTVGEGRYPTWFNGSINTANHTLWTAQSHITGGYVSQYFNGHWLRNYSGPGYQFSLQKFNIPSGYIEGNSQNTEWENHETGEFPYMYTYFATLAEAIPKPDLEVIEINSNTTMMRPTKPFVINATVNNTGAADATNQFNVSLYIDGDFYAKNTSISRLNAGESATVSFDPVNNLGAGCHEFKVVADSDGNVSESNENNNATSRHFQVGNVIVVQSNSDFERLNESGDSSLPPGCFRHESGAYYIQNLTITNCGGCGITIENTDVPFVINNCTVHNCGYDGTNLIDYYNGISMKNVTNGKVNGSIIEHNSGKGISVVEYSTCIDITNNTIKTHSERITSYGIEVGEVPLSAEDPKFLNITNNEFNKNSYGIDLIGFNCTIAENNIQHSDGYEDLPGYGIYVLSNYSNILLNNITNSTSYGIKVYNSSENHICWNIFINNNGSVAPQAWDNSQNSNYWNTTNPIGYYYPADTYTSYTNRTGNHWSDYTGSDTNTDGIGDSPYFIAGGDMADYYPLIPEQNCIIIDGIHLMTCGDVVAPYGVVDEGDAACLDAHVSHGTPAVNPWAGDMVAPFAVVDEGDAACLDAHVSHGVPCCCRPPWVPPPCQVWARLLNGWPMCSQGC